MWGYFDGTEFRHFFDTKTFVDFIKTKRCYVYMHNGGKFDLHLLLEHLEQSRALIINGRIVEIKLGKATIRDSFAIIPTSLAAFEKTKFEYWKMEAAVRAAHMPEILAYLRDDCVNLHTIVKAYTEAAGSKSTIASNAMAFSRKLGTDPGRTGARFDANFRKFYFGGRVEVFKGGSFDYADVFDIKSSYPFAMLHEHATGTVRHVTDNLDSMTPDEINRAFIELECLSDGAFPIIAANGGLTFPHQFAHYNVTGWEYATAIKHNLISRINIKRVVKFAATINFADYVNHWFAHKDAADKAGDRAQRLIGKIMMNSLYGKLAQNPRNYKDFVIQPLGTPPDSDNGWKLEYEFGNLELHSRDALWRYKQDERQDWEERPIFYNVATGASVTGFARAHLLDAICLVGRECIAYCDTDSIVALRGGATVNLRKDGKLGAWEWEGSASPVHIAGKKLYGMKFTAGPNEGKYKFATKGARLWPIDGKPDERALEKMRRIVNGDIYEWRNEAPSFSLAHKPSFVVRRIRATL